LLEILRTNKTTNKQNTQEIVEIYLNETSKRNISVTENRSKQNTPATRDKLLFKNQTKKC